MKKVLLTVIGAAMLVACAVPLAGKAAVDQRTVIDFPTGAIGVSEQTYQELQDAYCTYDYCDPLVERLHGKVIVRMHHHGEMYLVDRNDGVPRLRSYLPDGFYKAGKRHYYISNGFRIRLKKGSAYATILKHAQDGSVVITPVSAYDFQGMINTCEDYSEIYGGDSSIYQECVVQSEVGAQVQERLQGRIILTVEGTGQMYYVPYSGLSTPYPVVLDKKVDQKPFFSFVKDNALPVKKKQLRRVMSGKLY